MRINPFRPPNALLIVPPLCLLISWTVGAVDASWRAAYEIINLSFPDLRHPFRKQWGLNEGWDEKLTYCLLAIWEEIKEEEKEAVKQMK